MMREVTKEPEMVRPIIAFILLCVSAPAFAADKADVVAPSAAVAAAWASEAKLKGPSSMALKALYGSYGALQTLDMVSTIKARQQGAREVNPMMSGSYGQASATKLLLAAATVAGVKVVEKKNRKAAFVTMIALNAATAVIVVNNYKNARQLAQR
jgi:hypothetical protein